MSNIARYATGAGATIPQRRLVHWPPKAPVASPSLQAPAPNACARDGKTFRYRADGASIVRFDQSGIDPFATSQELVLATCWPFDAIARGRVHMRKWSLSPRGQGKQKPGAVGGIWHWVAHTAREVAG
jgi:hypothetical protein